jgi:phytanoyl-CoA hydroxylase
MVHRGPHEFNTGFTWQVPTGPFQRLTADQVDTYDTNGYCVVPDVFSPAEVRQMTEEIDPIEARLAAALSRRSRHDVAPDEFTVSATLVQRSAVLRRFCTAGPMPDMAKDLLGPAVRLFWEQAVYKKPHTDRTFPWHQDNGKVFVTPQQYLTCWIALTDATEDNGCPVIAPGMHRLGTLRHWRSDDGWRCLDDAATGVPVPVPAGSIALFSAVTTHMTGGNRTGSTRKAYVVQYAPDGAVATRREPDGTVTTVPQDDDDRQFLVA